MRFISLNYNFLFSPELQKKEVSAPVYGKRVEHLKSVIKACGMG